ncbi:transcription termination factor 2, mitochondrial [Pelodytes ibericus]
MLKGVLLKVLRWRCGSGMTHFPCKHLVLHSNPWICRTTVYSATYLSTVNTQATENKQTVESLYNLSVNITKIRQSKAWVLSKEVTFIEETVSFLKSLGANGITVANILERCPEAFLQDPTDTNLQRSIWNLVCPADQQLVKIIEKFPDAFFVIKCPVNQRANIICFQDLGLHNRIILRLLATCPQIFCNSVEANKHIIGALEESYLGLSGSKANFKPWLMKLLSQDPFIMLKPSSAIKKNLNFIQSLGFSDTDVLKLLAQLKGFIFDLSSSNMESSILFSKTVFGCDDQEMRQMIIKFPGILYYSVPVLEDRLKCLLREGASVGQVKECPNVLELTRQILEFRIKKMRSLGHQITDQSLEVLSGTKKDFEASYGRLQVKKERPLFNPVAPLHVEEE